MDAAAALTQIQQAISAGTHLAAALRMVLAMAKTHPELLGEPARDILTDALTRYDANA